MKPRTFYSELAYLAGIVLLGGGAIVVGILTWKAWKIEQAAVTKEDDTDGEA